MEEVLRGEKCIAFADRRYHQINRAIEHLEAEYGLALLGPTNKIKGCELKEQKTKSKRILSAIRAKAEYLFRIVKQQLAFTKVRYRGLKKNAWKIVMRSALPNLCMVCHRLLPATGRECP